MNKQKPMVRKKTGTFLVLLVLLFVGSALVIKLNDTMFAKVPTVNHIELTQTSQDLWVKIAKSDAIFLAVLTVPEATINQAVKNDQHSYVNIPANISEHLKGKPKDYPANIRHYTKDNFYRVTNNHLFAMHGKSVIIFAVMAQGEYYFTRLENKSLQITDPLQIDKIKSEIIRQKTITNNWIPNKQLPLYDRVAELIEIASKSGKEAYSFRQLENLGTGAVPAIIAQLDNRRRLNHRYITLKNHSPDRFEAFRHYSPKLMVDALTAILSQLTGQSFGTIYNGATDEKRTNIINGWRVYAMTHPDFENLRASSGN
ncbi:MAG: hypothetical protein JKY46_11840 [Robiginitomaculum sp.]|nr:hypothetical protein [Robiginitomaculum sp.]